MHLMKFQDIEKWDLSARKKQHFN